MSQRIVGLDIGSHSIKVLRVRSSLRSHEIERFDEEPLSWAEEADDSDAEARDEGASAAAPRSRGSSVLPPDLGRAIGALRARGSLAGDMLVVSYGLDQCLLTELTLPFSQRRQIETVLPIQIEDAFPVDIDELQTDFQLVGPPGPNGERRVQVAATPVARFAPFLNRLVRQELDPRVIEVGGARLLGAAKVLGVGSAEPTAIVDIGAQFTDICIIRGGEIRHLRRIRVGGDDFTDALAKAFQIDPEQAEQGKVREGFVPLHPQPGRDDDARVGDVCRGVAMELAQQLRHTLLGHAAQHRELVEQVYLCGGGTLLRGLPELLTAELGVAVRVLSVPGAVSREPGGEVRAVGAMGLVARGLPQRVSSNFNLRRGRFAFRGDFEFLKARAVALLVLVVLVIGAGLFMMISERRAVAARREAYASVLGNMSQAILGERLTTPDAVFGKIGQRTANGPYIPQNSAYEIFRDISQRLVDVREEFEASEGALEIERIYVDIHGDRAQVQGATHSAAAVDFLKLELEALPCLEGVNTGRTAQNRATGLYEFRIDARNVCD